MSLLPGAGLFRGAKKFNSQWFLTKYGPSPPYQTAYRTWKLSSPFFFLQNNGSATVFLHISVIFFFFFNIYIYYSFIVHFSQSFKQIEVLTTQGRRGYGLGDAGVGLNTCIFIFKEMTFMFFYICVFCIQYTFTHSFSFLQLIQLKRKNKTNIC